MTLGRLTELPTRNVFYSEMLMGIHGRSLGRVCSSLSLFPTLTHQFPLVNSLDSTPLI